MKDINFIWPVILFLLGLLMLINPKLLWKIENCFYCERWRTNGFIYCIYANRRTLIYVCINHFFSSMLCINHDV